MLVLDKENPLATVVTTRDGRLAKIVHMMNHNTYPLVAVFEASSGPNAESVGTYTLDGAKKWGQETPEDIVNAGRAKPEPKLRLDAPVQTRNGQQVRILCTNFKHNRLPVVAAVQPKDPRKREHLLLYQIDGRIGPTGLNPCDLVNIT